MGDKETILNLWKMGLNKMAVVNQFMKAHNKKAKNDKEVEKITKEQALRYVEPILFEYETSRMK